MYGSLQHCLAHGEDDFQLLLQDTAAAAAEPHDDNATADNIVAALIDGNEQMVSVTLFLYSRAVIVKASKLYHKVYLHMLCTTQMLMKCYRHSHTYTHVPMQYFDSGILSGFSGFSHNALTVKWVVRKVRTVLWATTTSFSFCLTILFVLEIYSRLD